MEKNLGQIPSSCVKVVLFGPESTGKTTLSKQLANHYNTEWVPEYARQYLQKKWDDHKATCAPEDIIPIAYGQIESENTLALKAREVLICDTDLLETKVYSEVYFSGSCDPILETFALQNTYDLYFLTDIDVPWVGDDLRDKPLERKQMFDCFEQALIRYGRPYMVLSGSKTERFNTATQIIDSLIAAKQYVY